MFILASQNGTKGDILLNLDNVIAFAADSYNNTYVISVRQKPDNAVNSDMCLSTPFSEIKKLIEEASFKDYVNNMAKLAETWPKA